ncbi:MAG: hydantoinase B/oxoprolinase family protein [Planctomycetota bacterium]
MSDAATPGDRRQVGNSRSDAGRGGVRLGVDRGGTFTDVVALAPDGRLRVAKLLTQQPGGQDATVVALHDPWLNFRDECTEPREVRVGTTVATNALLERRGERVLLITTRGFADLLEIGTQQRPELFALRIEKPPLLHERVLEIDERVLADGTVLRAPHPAKIRAGLLAARAAGLSSVAILLLHSWLRPEHELLVAELAREAGFAHVTLSHEISPEIGAVARGQTAVTEAFLTPLLRGYLAGVGAAAAQGTSLRFMQSDGGLVTAGRARGKNALLSGPAGGALALEHVARTLGLPAVIGLDMGGTSTDVCRCAPAATRRFVTEMAGQSVRAPTVDLVSVAAGGGSLLRLVDGCFLVGPQSAGADPGPACYGRGGPATLTDAQLVLGRLRPEHFPHLPLDVTAARRALSAFGEPEQAAAGFIAVADETMAAAIRGVSVARGHDPRQEALCCFGGAGGLHACALAERLGIAHVVIHPLAGVFSAFGLLLAPLTHHEVRAVQDPATRRPQFPEAEARAALIAQGVAAPQLLRSLDVRYAGADHVLNLPWQQAWHEAGEEAGDAAHAEARAERPWEREFRARHRAEFGFELPGCAIELAATRVEAVGAAPALGAVRMESRAPSRTRVQAVPARLAEAQSVQARSPAAAGPPLVRRRSELRPGERLHGPALLVEDHATTWLAPGWVAEHDAQHWLHLRRASPPAPLALADDPVGLQILSARFMSIAAEMGEQLRRSAHSVNIKERLDFSCALFDGQGRLVANAPHVPVHLGAMGETVRALLEQRGDRLRHGDAWLSNDPYHGGSHLPDLTVMTPVFRDGKLAFLVANRGHHADVGGPTPGSMPADSRHIEAEGALLSNLLLAREGELLTEEVSALLARAGTRGLGERLADLRAQVASNAAGVARLHALCEELGARVVAAWMERVQEHGAAVMEDVLSTLLAGRSTARFHCEDTLDDGTPLAVTVTLHAAHAQAGPRALIDFTGCGPQHAGNRNAPRAVVVAAVLYVFRTLAARPIPLNAGCLRPLEIRVPPGSLLDPLWPAAVCGGNVETSQRLVDLLYGALGLLAASQGTMNNVSFGAPGDPTATSGPEREGFAYYETVCGGAGAGPGFDGASAVHTHMTNTRLTDVEILERRLPVWVREFSIRRGSGGAGTWRGGDGVVRELHFLRPVSVSVLAERRSTVPFGLVAGRPERGASAGACGAEDLQANVLRLLTPGGGGFTPGPDLLPAR